MNKKDQIDDIAECVIGGTIDYRLQVAELVYKRGYRKQKEGEWIETQREWDFEPYFYTDYTCSVCGQREQNKSPFCRWCGAKMKGGAE